MNRMVSVRTEELTGPALDWAINAIEGEQEPAAGQLDLFDLPDAEQLITKYGVWIDAGHRHAWLADATNEPFQPPARRNPNHRSVPRRGIRQARRRGESPRRTDPAITPTTHSLPVYGGRGIRMSEIQRKTMCIYHGNCADGFGAAWVVRKALGTDVEFVPGVYGQEPPDVTGKDVILVDFSYKYDVLSALAYKANSIIVLDHHKSAAEDLARFEPFHAGIEEDTSHDDGSRLLGWKTAHDMAYSQNGPAIACCFDMNRSGAMLTWDHYFPDQEPPQLLRHIEDRDLWLFRLDGTREIQANLFSYPYDFEVWDQLMAADVQTLRSDGAAIERKHHKDVAELVAVTKRRLVIGGHDVPAASLPYTLTSDAGHLMAQGEPFAACYWDTPDGRSFSLRSTDEGLDVSEIAKQYGGGGHRNASGFRVPFGHELTL